MAIPSEYISNKHYFEDVIELLKDNEWMFNYPNTHILIKNVFNNIEHNWLEYFKKLTNEELNLLSIGKCSDKAPQSLKLFLDKINCLKPSLSVKENIADDLKLKRNCKINGKKKHEITYFAPAINNICKTQSIGYIVDVGSGHGYLSQYLHNSYGYKILGIETCDQKVEMARKYELCDKEFSRDDIKYVVHYIDENSAPFITNVLKENFPEFGNNKVCIVGLHACADLGITILELFSQMECAKSLIIMPCCYHRIELSRESDRQQIFKHFPISDTLKEVCETLNAYQILQTPFLRLACQQTNYSFFKMNRKEHENHAKNCLFRAILQEVAEEGNFKVIRKKRKSGKTLKNEVNFTFENYLDSLVDTHELLREVHGTDEKQLIDDVFRQKMSDKYNMYKGSCYLVEVLTGFQAAIQSVCENVILLDRVEFLREKGLQSIVHKVTDDRISPRCYALIAAKH